MSIKSKSLSQPYPVATKQIDGLVLPKLRKRKKRNLHTKNPFKTKVYLIPDDSVMKTKKLDGFLLLKITSNDMPHEIFRANLSRLRIVDCSPDDFRYFLNLEELDLSENSLQLEVLTTFPSLQILHFCANNIQEIELSEQNTFRKLQILDVSFNYLDLKAIESLANIPLLENLSISNNELVELPETMEQFYNLKKLDISDNSLSSNYNASQLWLSLATIPNLEELNVSKNFLRGIHTEKLIAGHFQKLKILDISYNVVENQHNLICARNFKNMQKIIVTGNPFAIFNEIQGIEMEIHARTGAKLINEEVPMPYLRKPKKIPRPPIKYEKLNKVEEDYFKTFQSEEQGPQPEIKEEENQISEGEGVDEVLFVTEHQGKTSKNKPPQQSIQTSAKENQSIEGAEKNNSKNNANYDEFKKMAYEILGESQEYDMPGYDLNTAYKTLKNVMNRPDAVEYNNFEEPNYLKPTASIQRYKFSLGDTSQQQEKSNKQTNNKKQKEKQPSQNQILQQSKNEQKEEEFNFDFQNIYKQS